MNSYLKGPFLVIGTIGQLCRKTKIKIKVVILRTNHTSRLRSNFINQSVKDTGQRLKRGKTDLSERIAISFFTARYV